jgi:glucose/arabinose dehydrogenase
MRGGRGALLALVLGVAAFAPLGAQGLPAPQATPDSLLLVPLGTFSSPTYLTAPDGDQHRLFVVQQGGLIKVVVDNVINTTPFLNATSWVRSGGEEGLLSMAFAPDYATSGLFYIAYTQSDFSVRVDELHVSADPNVADPASRRQVIVVPHPGATNHNGGQIQFGPDGMLYIGIGDGGSEGDPNRRGQDLRYDLAKILRIDPRAGPTGSYRIPPNNPFVGRRAANPEIWSYGLRNPWRFSFDRLTGDLTIGDVGQDQWEEIDFRPVGFSWGRGTNFGWSCYEARHTYNSCSPEPPDAIPPVFEYQHGSRCSIGGGYVVRDPELTTLAGEYLYTDLCDGHIRAQTLHIPDSTGDVDTQLTVSSAVSFGEDGCGHIYVVGQGSSPNVFRLRQSDPPPPDCAPKFPLPVLHADVNDDFSIHMYGPDGQPLDGGTLPQGSYRLELDDNSEFHNFHLLRPFSLSSVPGTVSCVPMSSCATDVGRTGHETWIVNFTPGPVQYQCDPHAEFMHGSFTVTG